MVASAYANLKRSSLLVQNGAAYTWTYDGSTATRSGATSGSAGDLFRVLGKKVVTPAQGSTSTSNQVVLLKVVKVTAVANSAVGEGDGVSTLPVYVNLLDGKFSSV
jgi:hypothetical protein